LSLTLDSRSNRSVGRKKWDTELLAYLGAFLGVAFGCMYEVKEAISHDMSEVEPFAQIVGEITAAALAGAALFAAVSAIRNWASSLLNSFRDRRSAAVAIDQLPVRTAHNTQYGTDWIRPSRRANAGSKIAVGFGGRTAQ